MSHLNVATDGGEFLAIDRRSVALFDCPDAAATERLGEDIAHALRAGDVVALSGDLGAGKSTLARAMIRAMAADETLEVPSPTYTLVQIYDLSPPVAHFDLYRLGAGDDELAELGFEEAAEGIVLVEWPSMAASVIERATLKIELTASASDGRTVRVEAEAEAEIMERLSRSFALRAFLAEHGLADTVRQRFHGDASSRRYEKLAGRPETLLVMDAPRQPDGPPVRDGLAYSALVHLAEDVNAFVALSQALIGAGFSAPAIRAADLEQGFLILDHLGTQTLLDSDGAPDPERYAAAIDCLVDLHLTPWPSRLPVTDGIIHEVPIFDRRAMAIEVELVLDWYVPHAFGRPASEEERSLFLDIWNALFDELGAVETTLALRDFHSPNVIWRPEETGRRRIGLIDFQDAVIAPSAYDVASLAQDARVDVPEQLEAQLVATYIASRRARNPDFDAFGFEQAYAIMAAQRASKILGIFVRLLERDGKPQYLRHIPRIKSYLDRTLGHPALAALRSLYEDLGVVTGAGSSRQVRSCLPDRSKR